MPHKKHLLTLRQALSDISEALRGSDRDFTTGSIGKAVFLLSLPMVLEMTMQSIFEVADIYFVGKLGADAIAAVGLTGTLIILVFAVGIGFSMGATALVARRIGEHRPDLAARVAAHAIGITVLLSLPFSLVGIFFAPELLQLMGASPDVVNVGTGYCQLLFGGNVTIMLLFVINAVFRGAGDASVAMKALFLANTLNIILDPILIFGLGPIPAFGIEGAAIATIIGRAIGVCFQLYILTRGSGRLSMTRAAMVMNPAIVRNLIKVSIPGIIQFLVSTASWILVVRLVTLFGDAAVAGYTVAVRIIIFTLLPSWGLSNAAATLVGQNLGAKQPQRATDSVRICSYYNVGFLAVVTLGLLVYAPVIISWFTTDPPVAREGIICLRYIACGYIAEGVGMVLMQAFNGAGDTRTPTWINGLALWVFQLPAGYFLAVTMGLGTAGIYIGAALAQFVLAALAYGMFKTDKWKYALPTQELSGNL